MNELLLKEQQKFLSQKLENSTVTVSGATGLIGSRIVKYLLVLNKKYDSNITINALYRSIDKFNNVYKDYLDDNALKSVYFDTQTPLDGKTDYIIHCAGIAGGKKMHLKDPVLMFDVAYYSTKAMLEYAVKSGCKRFCYISTYEVYGTPVDDRLISENNPCTLDTMQLRNIYPIGKRMCESMCVAYSSMYGLDIMCGRLTSTFGYGVEYDDPRFFAEFARCAVNKKDIVLKSMGNTVRSYLDSDDAASAFLYILVNGESCNTYNTTNMDNEISIREIAEKVISLSGENVNLVFDVAEDIEKLGFRKEGVTLMDASKLYALGWKPVYTLDDTLNKLIDTIKEKNADSN